MCFNISYFLFFLIEYELLYDVLSLKFRCIGLILDGFLHQSVRIKGLSIWQRYFAVAISYTYVNIPSRALHNTLVNSF